MLHLHTQVANLHSVQNTSTSTSSEHHSPLPPPLALPLYTVLVANAASSGDLTLPPATLVAAATADVGECLPSQSILRRPGPGYDSFEAVPSETRADLRGISPNCVRRRRSARDLRFALLVLCSTSTSSMQRRANAK